MCMVHTSGTRRGFRDKGTALERRVQCGFTTESTRHAVLQTPSRIIVVCRIIVVSRIIAVGDGGVCVKCVCLSPVCVAPCVPATPRRDII